MEKYFFSDKNIKALSSNLENRLGIRENDKIRREKCKEFLVKNMKKVYDKYGSIKPKNVSSMEYLDKLSKKSLSDSIKIYEQEKSKRTAEPQPPSRGRSSDRPPQRGNPSKNQYDPNNSELLGKPPSFFSDPGTNRFKDFGDFEAMSNINENDKDVYISADGRVLNDFFTKKDDGFGGSGKIGKDNLEQMAKERLGAYQGLKIKQHDSGQSDTYGRSTGQYPPDMNQYQMPQERNPYMDQDQIMQNDYYQQSHYSSDPYENNNIQYNPNMNPRMMPPQQYNPNMNPRMMPPQNNNTQYNPNHGMPQNNMQYNPNINPINNQNIPQIDFTLSDNATRRKEPQIQHNFALDGSDSRMIPTNPIMGNPITNLNNRDQYNQRPQPPRNAHAQPDFTQSPYINDYTPNILSQYGIMNTLNENELDGYLGTLKKTILNKLESVPKINDHIVQNLNSKQIGDLINKLSSNMINMSPDTDKQIMTSILKDSQDPPPQEITEKFVSVTKQNIKTEILSIDSSLFASSDHYSDYLVTLKTPIEQITSFELSSIKTFPEFENVKYNKLLKFKIDGIERVIKFDENYSPLKKIFNFISSNIENIEITTDESNHVTIKILNDKSFELNNDKNSLLKPLGFTKDYYFGSTSYKSEEPHKISHYDKIYLYIDNIDDHQPFAQMDTKKGFNLPVKKLFDPPISLKDFVIQFKTTNDPNTAELYDFKKHPHELVFKIQRLPN